MRRFGSLFPAVLSLWLVWAGASPADAAGRQSLEIATAGGTRTFSVELAKTRPELDRGLMYRRSLPAGRGMLFDFGSVQPIAMWMKNTYVSLDMLFFDADGRISHIQRRTRPLSEDLVSSGGEVAGVLELLAGEAERRGIRTGDRILLPRL
jgi:uncharacterized membrane protein (UPF0127 family)